MEISANIQQLKPSATLAINERSQALIYAGKTVYRLGFGQSPFPVPAEVVAALQEHAHRKDYLPVKGLYALREAVASFNVRTLGIDCVAEQVLIGPGSKELIYDLLLAIDATLLLPSPAWVSYEPQAILAHRPVHRIETDPSKGWLLTARELQQASEQIQGPKVLVLNYPCNPTGTSFTPDQLTELASVARQHEILVIADEIYGEVHHQGKHQSLAQYYPEGTIISSGLSKWCGAGGWRLGTFTFPKPYLHLLDILATIASETFTSVSAPIQFAAVKAFAGSPAIDRYVSHSQEILGAVARYVYRQLQALHISMPPADGGFYLFPDFAYYHSAFARINITTNSLLCEHLLEYAGVALLPGEAFGRPAEELNARLSFVDFDGANALAYRAAHPKETLGDEFVLRNCPAIVGAMNALETYLSSL